MKSILFVHEKQHVCDKIEYMLADHFHVTTAQSLHQFSETTLSDFSHIIVDKQISVLLNIPYLTCSFSNGNKNELSYVWPIEKWTTLLKASERPNLCCSDEKCMTTPKKQIITFVGSRGNVGTTTIALSCAHYLKSFGSVCYLCMLPLQQEGVFENHTMTFSTVLSAIKTNQSINLMEFIVNDQGIMTFIPCVDRLDYTAVTQEDMQILLTLIQEQLRCDYIIIDTVLQDVLYQKIGVKNSQKLFVIDMKEQLHTVQLLMTNFSKSEQIHFDKIYYVLNQKDTSKQHYDVIIPSFMQDVTYQMKQFLQSSWQVYL